MLKEKIKNGEKLIGTHIVLKDLVSGTIAGLSGYDYVWIDMEHNCISFETLLALMTAVKAGGTDVVVRVPQNDFTATKKVMEMGPDGIIFPMVKTPEEANALISYTLYPPHGVRGYGPMNAVKYGCMDTKKYCAENHETMCRFVQVEHIDAVNNLDRILKNDFIDGYIIGPFDLSGSICELGNVYGENTTALIKTTVEKVKARGKCVGLSTGAIDDEGLKHWADLGIDMISAGTDHAYIREGMKKTRETMERIIKGK